MFHKVFALFIAALLLGFSIEAKCSDAADEKKKMVEREKPLITSEDAQQALCKLIESEKFLSGAQYLQPIKRQILSDNKLIKNIQSASEWSAAPGGTFIGMWGFHAKSNSFSYLTKTPDGKELYTVRGNFLLNEKNQWTAKIREASITRLTNFFDKRDYDKIKIGTTLQEVTKLLNAPPGAYYSEKMGFIYPGDRRWLPFTGTGKEFEDYASYFIESKADSKSKWMDRAWVSNEIGIWIIFYEGRVRTKASSEIFCPNVACNYVSLFGREKLK